MLVVVCHPYAQTNPYSAPWKDPNIAILIDLYAGNDIDWNVLKADQQLAAIIHKASQGLNSDAKYAERRKTALSLGYKWGSYHLGTNEDPIKQADHYLGIVENHSNELIALDLESNDSSKHMNIRNAALFIKRIYEKTGRY